MITVPKMAATTEANQRKVNLLKATTQTLLAETLHHGFFGAVVIELSIHDGTIQSVCSTVKRIEQ